MKNTTLYCLKCLAGGGWLNADSIARRRWPNSRQIGKKAVTVNRHLETLVRHGYARRVGDQFNVTAAGEAIAPDATQRERPPLLQLVGKAAS